MFFFHSLVLSWGHKVRLDSYLASHTNPLWTLPKCLVKWHSTDLPGDKPAHHCCLLLIEQWFWQLEELSWGFKVCTATHRITTYSLKQTSTLSASNAAHVSHKTAPQAHSRAFSKKQYGNSVSLSWVLVHIWIHQKRKLKLMIQTV